MHCVDGTTAKEWSISGGHIKLNSSEAAREEGYQIARVRYLRFHPLVSQSRFQD